MSRVLASSNAVTLVLASKSPNRLRLMRQMVTLKYKGINII